MRGRGRPAGPVSETSWRELRRDGPQVWGPGKCIETSWWAGTAVRGTWAIFRVGVGGRDRGRFPRELDQLAR